MLATLNGLARFRDGEPPGEPISQGARTEPRPTRITEAHSGREAHERGGSELAVHDSVGSGDGLNNRLQLADLIDLDAVEWHGDLMNGTGEIDENAPNEPNFDETMSIVEAQGPTQAKSSNRACSVPGGNRSPRASVGQAFQPGSSEARLESLTDR